MIERPGEAAEWPVLGEAEQNAAGKALQAWFHSQGIKPMDACEVMIMVIANAVHALAGDDERLAGVWRSAIAAAVLRPL